MARRPLLLSERGRLFRFRKNPLAGPQGKRRKGVRLGGVIFERENHTTLSSQ